MAFMRMSGVDARGLLAAATFAGIGATQEGAPGKQLAELRAGLVAEAQSLLRSDDWQKAAWGAYSAAESRLTECIPDLRSKLQAVARSEHKERPFTALALLDALIQTDASVPCDELAPFTDELCLPSTLLLLGKDNWWRIRGLLLQTFRQYGDFKDTAWQACGNLLAIGRHPEFVLDLLRMPVVVRITVCDPGRPVAVGSAGGVACGSCYAPESYPPIAHYVLGVYSDPGTIMVANGTPPVVARRVRAQPGQAIGKGFWNGGTRVDTARAAWLATMLGEDHRVPACPLELTDIVEWQDAAGLLAAERARLGEAQRQWQALVDACVASKLIGSEAAGQLRPPITVRLEDERTDRSQPLPDVK